MKLPASMVALIPESVDDETAAFTAIGAIALHGVHRTAAGAGDVIPVVGLGLIGLLAVQILRAYGVTVIGVDPIEARRELAISFGAERTFGPNDPILRHVTQEVSEGRGADAVLVAAAASSSGPVELASALVAPHGRVVLVGATGMSLPGGELYRKEADVLISRSYGPGRYDDEIEEGCRPLATESSRWSEQRNFDEFLRLAATGAIAPSELITGRVSFDAPERAYDDLIRRGDRIIASVLTYDEVSAVATAHDASTAASSETSAPNVRTKPAAIPVAVVGHGDFAKRVHLPALAGSDRYDVRWLIGRQSRRAKEIGERFGIGKTADRLDAALEEEAVQAVFIFTRHDTHARLARECLSAGKGVFLEKPIALTPGDAASVREVVERRALPFAIGFNRRHSLLATRFREYAARRRTPIQMLFRVAGTYLPAEHWVYDPELGGGRIIGEACHFIDFLRWIVGEEITDVTARGGTWTHSGHRIIDNATATFTFASGSIGTLLYSDLGRADFPKERFELLSGEIALALDDFVTLKVAGDIDASIRLDKPDKGFERELTAFADYLRTSEPGDLAGARDGEAALVWGIEIEHQLFAEDGA